MYNIELKPPSSYEGIIAYLSSDLFKGIGKKKAKKIVDCFGTDTISIIKNQPELLPLVIDNCQSQNYHLEHGLPCGIFIIGEDEIVKQFNGRIDDLIIAKSYPNGYDAFLYNVNNWY